MINCVSMLNNSKKRVLSVFSLVMINVIAIDSLRNLPTNADNGLTILLFYLIAAAIFLVPSVLVTAELATHRPKTGGVYVWVREAFGPQWGFFTIWLQWIYNVFWYPTILSFIAVNIAYFFNPALAADKAFMLPMILGMFVLATIANSYGMTISSVVSSISAIVGTIIPMALIILLGAVWLWMKKPLAISLNWHNFIPHFSHISNLAFLVVVFFSLMGIEMSAVHAEEVKNPERDYPRALYYSALIIVISAALSSTAIALIVPQQALNIVSGLDQAFALFLNAFHLKWLLPVTIFIIILGGFGSMAAWVIGPTKGLMVAAEDGSLPAWMSYRNKRGAPLGVLLMQVILVVFLCLLFLLIPSFNTSYWILSDLTAQLALIFYIPFFAAAIRLRFKTERKEKCFRIPGGNFGIWLVGCVGIIACITAILVGFIPPAGVKIYSVKIYEMILVGGLILFSLPPFVIYAIQKRKSSATTISQ
ncbi:amino acid permease [Coxiella burnetii]|uniref:amino acid permease n=1 Tax=Coxiella burnetii TaxID=777 RepID=UPI000183CEBB|nr:amino acid permease [Coxiella burnetii]ACJ19271.1 glutamate/gamma-aminobutyrate antiporter [Coxiella burnetii CbuG_Q212]OYK85339.1 amino acid permease [Coxiella burnetii]